MAENYWFDGTEIWLVQREKSLINSTISKHMYKCREIYVAAITMPIFICLSVNIHNWQQLAKIALHDYTNSTCDEWMVSKTK